MSSHDTLIKSTVRTGNPNAPTVRRPVLTRLHRFIARSLGIDVSQGFVRILEKNSRRLLVERLERSKYRSILESESEKEHYGDIEITQTALLNVISSFTAARLEFIDRCLGTEIKTATFADVGDSNGIFLRALGKAGVAVNITPAPLRQIAARGVCGVQSDAMHLAFRDSACDYILSFETLEHLPDPFAALNELYRVCRKGVFISVPNVNSTTVYPRYDDQGPEELHHIFELSRAHWDALFSHTGFKVAEVIVVPVVDVPKGLDERIAFAAWRILFGKDTFSSTLKSFLLYRLSK